MVALLSQHGGIDLDVVGLPRQVVVLASTTFLAWQHVVAVKITEGRIKV